MIQPRTMTKQLGIPARGQFLELIPNQPWRNQANCLETNPDEFFASHGVSWATIWNRVQHLCEPCPVRKQCREYGATQSDGMYGGLAMDGGRRVSYKPLKACGTVAAYRRHVAANEIPCGACKKANREYVKERR